MAELKTQRNDGDVAAFVAGIADERRREDAATLVGLMGRVTGRAPEMWGTAIVGFGERSYRYASGRSGTWFTIGFSPRKANTTVYTYGGFDEPETAALLERLGPHSTGKGCLYVKRLADVDAGVLESLLRRAVARADEAEAGDGTEG
jgi:hypothetical protein